ncbi:MAG: hypothetical protein IH597_09855 [Bacteroidales bacterium]|nr:hypothetical protein [Bacteroidales bacterium]
MPNKLLTFVMTLFISYSAVGQVKDCKVLLVKRDYLKENFITNIPLSKDDSTYVTLLQDDPNYLNIKGGIEFDHSAVKSHYLIIQFIDNNSNFIQNQNVGIQTISLKEMSGNRPADIIPSTFTLDRTYILIDLNRLGDNPKNEEVIEIEIKLNNSQIFKRYFKYINGWQAYNFANNKFGLWLPINMYSTSFDRSANGILFTAMPIGLALGGKYNINQNFYIGISGTLNYTIANATNSTTDNSYYFQDFSVGPLIDLGGYAYLGYTMPVNLTSEPSKLKSQFVIGVGLKITELLTGK